MELANCQNEMHIIIKKYLALSVQKNDSPNAAAVEKEMFQLLLQLVAVNERQKGVLHKMRAERASSIPENSFQNKDDLSTNESCLPSMDSKDENKEEFFTILDNQESTIPLEHIPTSEDSPIDSSNDQTIASKSTPSPLIEECSYRSLEDSQKDSSCESLLMDEDTRPLSPVHDDSSLTEDDIHELVTAEEFMHSIGLLTTEEHGDVVCKRRERQKKNKFSHVFSLAMYEKQETKRKGRDWLKSSPPQLRRKIRPNSQPSSRQPSRPNSPNGCGSSSSNSPESPSSPADQTANRYLITDETCNICKENGAKVQCDGCGVSFHSLCVNLKAKECDLPTPPGWLCFKCEKLGIRNSVYEDPLREPLWKETLETARKVPAQTAKKKGPRSYFKKSTASKKNSKNKGNGNSKINADCYPMEGSTFSSAIVPSLEYAYKEPSNALSTEYTPSVNHSLSVTNKEQQFLTLSSTSVLGCNEVRLPLSKRNLPNITVSELKANGASLSQSIM